MWSPFSFSPPCLLRRVLVNTTDPNVSFQAVLWQQRGPWLVYREAFLLSPDKPPQKMDGELVLHREKVLFHQVIS